MRTTIVAALLASVSAISLRAHQEERFNLAQLQAKVNQHSEKQMGLSCTRCREPRADQIIYH